MFSALDSIIRATEERSQVVYAVFTLGLGEVCTHARRLHSLLIT